MRAWSFWELARTKQTFVENSVAWSSCRPTGPLTSAYTNLGNDSTVFEPTGFRS
jgi:hypothetical protein